MRRERERLLVQVQEGKCIGRSPNRKYNIIYVDKHEVMLYFYECYVPIPCLFVFLGVFLVVFLVMLLFALLR
jgi:hypothetical protein